MDEIDQLYQRATHESENGNPIEAARLYREMIKLLRHDERKAAFYLLAANANVDAGRFEEAIDDCHSALSVEPTSAAPGDV